MTHKKQLFYFISHWFFQWTTEIKKYANKAFISRLFYCMFDMQTSQMWLAYISEYKTTENSVLYAGLHRLWQAALNSVAVTIKYYL